MARNRCRAALAQFYNSKAFSGSLCNLRKISLSDLGNTNLGLVVTHASSVAVVTASSVLVILTKLLLRLLGSGVGQPQVGLVGLGAAHNRGHGLGFALEQTISVFRRNCSLLPVELETKVKQRFAKISIGLIAARPLS